MRKLEVKDVMPDFSYRTPFRSNLTLSQELSVPKTCLIFLRYYGCPLCQLDIMNFKKNYDKIQAANAQIKIVLQSDSAMLFSQLDKDDLPFEIICDPDQELYKEFDIKPGKSLLQISDLHTFAKLIQVKKHQITHGEYEGNELQLPATFIIDKQRLILYAHYGKSVSDVPSIDELLKQLI